jgi:hypothetical protein
VLYQLSYGHHKYLIDTYGYKLGAQRSQGFLKSQGNSLKLLTILPIPCSSISTMKQTLILFCFLIPTFAHAGVFNIPEFVDYKSWAVGLEPEVAFDTYGHNQSSGVSLTAKFTYGITPLSNLQVGIGAGSNSEAFNTGGTYTFDFLPDLEGQIGAGLALQVYYYKLQNSVSQTIASVYPYVHKMFTTNTGLQFDPYAAIPFGTAFYDGTYRSTWQLVVGNYFKTAPHFGFNIELGVSLKDTDSYISGGITYRD